MFKFVLNGQDVPLPDKRDMHDSLQLSWNLMFFKLFVVDFYLENQDGGFETDFLSVPLNNIIPLFW